MAGRAARTGARRCSAERLRPWRPLPGGARWRPAARVQAGTYPSARALSTKRKRRRGPQQWR
eukprot:2483270-Pleurochrysis_carterae.AAC.1